MVDAAEHLGLARAICIRRYHVDPRDLDDSDIYAVACLGLVKAAASYQEGRGAQFQTYAWRCMWNELTDHFSKRKRHNVQAVGGTTWFGGMAAPRDQRLDLFDRSDDLRQIRDCMTLLPRHWRTALLMRAQGDLYRDIAKRLKVTRSNARRLHEKAVMFVRRLLDVEGEGNTQ